MVFRLRNASALALLLAFLTSLTVFAKGQFAFIAITGPGIEGEVRTTDSKLAFEFFAFADFYRDRIETPANPGEGYEITRYYAEGRREIAFDQLHYYPSTGLVFYDGIVNGDSEYDGGWYSANPDIKTAFESALPAWAVAKPQSLQPAQHIDAFEKAQSVAKASMSQLMMPIVILAGLVILLSIAARQRTSAIK